MAAFLLLAAALVTLLSGQWTCLVGHYPKDQLGPSGQRMMSVSSHRTLQGFSSQTSFLCWSVVYTHTHTHTHRHTQTHTEVSSVQRFIVYQRFPLTSISTCSAAPAHAPPTLALALPGLMLYGKDTERYTEAE